MVSIRYFCEVGELRWTKSRPGGCAASRTTKRAPANRVTAAAAPTRTRAAQGPNFLGLGTSDNESIMTHVVEAVKARAGEARVTENEKLSSLLDDCRFGRGLSLKATSMLVSMRLRRRTRAQFHPKSKAIPRRTRGHAGETGRSYTNAKLLRPSTPRGLC